VTLSLGYPEMTLVDALKNSAKYYGHWDSIIYYRKKIIYKELLEQVDLALVNGDVEIEGNIKLIQLPGHTKGLQGVAVPTNNGLYLISADHFYTYANINPPKEPYTIKDLAGNNIQLPPSHLPFLTPDFMLIYQTGIQVALNLYLWPREK